MEKADTQTSKSFFRHAMTGEIYAVEHRWDGELVGSAGPLPEDGLKDLDSYEYRPDRNDWIHDNSDKLILI
jgi:hypothetical protein